MGWKNIFKKSEKMNYIVYYTYYYVLNELIYLTFYYSYAVFQSVWWTKKKAVDLISVQLA